MWVNNIADVALAERKSWNDRWKSLVNWLEAAFYITSFRAEFLRKMLPQNFSHVYPVLG
jgi:hypothetical protein